MDLLYTWCAVGAGALFVVQTLLALIGLGNAELEIGDVDIGDVDIDADVDVEHDNGSDTRLVGALSIKAVLAGVTIFGLTGLTASRHMNEVQAMTVAMAAAAGTMYTVGWLIHGMHRLRSDGTVNIRECIGTVGSVYLTVPGGQTGPGKVTVEIQGRTMEFAAVTEGDPLPTGCQVEVCDVLSTDTVIVRPHTVVSTQA